MNEQLQRAQPPQVWIVELAGIDVEGCESILSHQEIAGAQRLVSDSLRVRFLARRLALRSVAGSLLEERPAAIEFEYSVNEAPRISRPRSPLRLSVSTSGGLALIAVTRGPRVGVDVEIPRDSVDVDAITKRFLHVRERETIMAIERSRRRSAFYACWTAKEAYAKALGLGLARPLDSYAVEARPDRPLGLIEDRSGAGEWSFFRLDVGSGIFATLVVEGRDVSAPRVDAFRRRGDRAAALS